MTNSYEHDFYGWTLEQAEALRAAATARINTPRSIDWENVAEEIESMGREQAATLKSKFRVLLSHLLKWRHQPALRGKSWRNTIRRERREIPDHLADNPGLKPKADTLFAAAYRLAREDAEDETDLPLATFPEACPFTREQALDSEFWPD